MKKIALLLFCLFSLSTWAENALSITTTDGNIVQYRLSVKATISFKKDVMVISTRDMTVEYPISKYLKMSIDEYDETSIDQLNEKQFIFTYKDGVLEAGNFKAKQRLQLYDMQGKCLSSSVMSENGTATVNLHVLPQGTYLVKVGEISYKIVK